jgi:GMP synthase PP-ATPase subunit
VNREQVRILQLADTIYIEEIRKAGLYDQIAQAFAVLLPVKAVGVMGDQRTYEQVRTSHALPFLIDWIVPFFRFDFQTLAPFADDTWILCRLLLYVRFNLRTS